MSRAFLKKLRGSEAVSRSGSDYSLDLGECACYVVYLVRRNTQLPCNLRQGKNAANRALACWNFFNRQGMVTTGESERSNHVAYAGPLNIVEIEDLQSIRRRHDVAYHDSGAANPPFLRKPYRLIAQDVR